MAKISLDYNLEEVSSTFEPLPQDNYVAVVEDAPEFKKSSNNKDMLVFIWTITEGEYEGRKLYDNVVTTVSWKVKQYCELAGVENGSELDTQDFKGLEAVLTVTQEADRQNSDIIRNKISKMEPVG